GWCPKCRGFGELFYLPDVERGARADAIEESWFGWQEGNREICPDCNGTRINPIARAVRLPLPRGRWSRLTPHPGPLPVEGRGRSALRSVLGSSNNGRSFNPTIQFFGDLPVEDAYALCDRIHFRGREAIIARDILPEIRERLKFL